jgi:bifunctional non-homologous end joining protein LigD
MLHRRAGITMTLFVSDLLAVEGLAVTSQPYAERSELLDELDIEGPCVRLAPTFEDGDALFAAVCERGIEGAVAKRDHDPYRPGERHWVKIKNRATARFAEERRLGWPPGRSMRDGDGLSPYRLASTNARDEDSSR